jgi:hypothetical protein
MKELFFPGAIQTVNTIIATSAHGLKKILYGLPLFRKQEASMPITIKEHTTRTRERSPSGFRK